MSEAITPFHPNALQNKYELVEEICGRIAEGESLTEICSLEGMPRISTVMRWVTTDELVKEAYARAREAQAHTYAARVMDEAFSAKDAQLGRLRVDALKWAASKLAPKTYGDNMQLRHADADGAKLDTAPLVNELLTLMPGGAPLKPGAPLIEGSVRNVTPAKSETPIGLLGDKPYRYRPRAKRPPPADDGSDLV